VASNPPPDTILHPITGRARPLSQFLTVFHLVLVVVDPYTNESAWIIDTAGRVLETFTQADCRVGWMVAGDPDECRAFLGPWAERFTTFSDPEREAIKAFGLERLPAIVHLGMDATMVSSAEGWQPSQWQAVTDEVARMVGWKGPTLPGLRDPAPYRGTPALG
jgi:hypothetical protein